MKWAPHLARSASSSSRWASASSCPPSSRICSRAASDCSRIRTAPRSLVADVTFLDARRLSAETDATALTDVALAMSEDEFRAFYDRTSGPLWGYLSRISGDRQVADDLLQESYYRLLKSNAAFESEHHRRNYLYRIPTNLGRDGRRTMKPSFDEGVELANVAAPDGHSDAESRADVRRALGRLKPRER